MNTQKPLPKFYIKKKTILIKEFLFTFIDDLYKNLKLLTSPLRYIENNDQKGNFIFDFNRLTKLELVNIILESIMHKKKRYGL